MAAAAADRAPHRITTWVRELAGAVHGFYHDCHVMGEGVSPELTQARLWLVDAAETGLAIGLDLLGVSAPGVDVTDMTLTRSRPTSCPTRRPSGPTAGC